MAHGPEAIRAAIHRMLDASGRDYEVVEHPEPESAEAAAELRGVPMAAMCKTLLMKGDAPLLVTLRYTDQVDNRALRTALAVRKLRFLSREQLLERTGLVPYTVPPVGRPVLDFDLVVEQGIAGAEWVAFGTGLRTESVRMRGEDWIGVTGGRVLSFAA